MGQTPNTANGFRQQTEQKRSKLCEGRVFSFSHLVLKLHELKVPIWNQSIRYYDKQAHPNKSAEQLQELINQAKKEYQVFLFLEDESFMTQQFVQAARADNGRVFYQLADSVLPAFASVGRVT